MNCEKAKALILSDNGYGEKLETHVTECAECRSLASAWNTLKHVKPPLLGEPSKNLDFKIRGAAADYLDKRKIHHTVFIRRIFMYATAACCVFVTWFAINGIGNSNVTHKNGFVSKSTIPWSTIDMEKDFFELTTELELSIQNIYSGGSTENGSERDFDMSFPDLST